jgi:hypothetical protein
MGRARIAQPRRLWDSLAMRWWLPVPASLALAACASAPADRPPRKVLDRLEAKLADNPCIGPLKRWSRSYAWAVDPRARGAGDQVVEFLFEEAGKFEFREGRHVFGKSGLPFKVDDRAYRIAYGLFDPATGKVEVKACGANSDGP